LHNHAHSLKRCAISADRAELLLKELRSKHSQAGVTAFDERPRRDRAQRLGVVGGVFD